MCVIAHCTTWRLCQFCTTALQIVREKRRAVLLLGSNAGISNWVHEIPTMGARAMTGWKSVVVLAAIIGTVAVTACRREMRHEPLKGLGAADVPMTQQIAE